MTIDENKIYFRAGTRWLAAVFFSIFARIAIAQNVDTEAVQNDFLLDTLMFVLGALFVVGSIKSIELFFLKGIWPRLRAPNRGTKPVHSFFDFRIGGNHEN